MGFPAFPYLAITAIEFLSMAFPRFLNTKAMGEFVTCHFSWDRRGKAFPPSPLPKDFQTLYPGFELAVAEQAAEYYGLPELPQVIFYAMLINEAERLGVLQGQRLRRALLSCARAPLNRGSGYSAIGSMKLDTTQRVVRERMRELVVWERARVGGTPAEGARERLVFVFFIIMAFPPTHNTTEMANYVRETFICGWRSASRPPRPFPEDFHVLCPHFSLAEAEGAAAEFELTEIV
ncbi:hypothetical protein Cgig2_005128 [Carnegiea gigantea]|uniref:Uncharacterized protein n=1 Tax=Carnegiea gigantea TaxID=171969 RepID=A0A9Q1KG25_9CARY|nr:hypothetical protein Cgig2_005128 [Carnegiea gigantea]